MLMVMGTALMPGCDEGKGNNPIDLLVMQYAANSKYYLRFDVDYNNDAVVDEHVEMRVTRHFDLSYYDNWYQAMFTKTSDKNVSIYLPDTTSGPCILEESSDHFRFFYDYYSIDYKMINDHIFSLEIITWDDIKGEIYAEFSGEISNNFTGDEKIAVISNGELFARIYN